MFSILLLPSCLSSSSFLFYTLSLSLHSLILCHPLILSTSPSTSPSPFPFFSFPHSINIFASSGLSGFLVVKGFCFLVSTSFRSFRYPVIPAFNRPGHIKVFLGHVNYNILDNIIDAANLSQCFAYCSRTRLIIWLYCVETETG
jgi:hypothetical protein